MAEHPEVENNFDETVDQTEIVDIDAGPKF